MSKTYYQTFLFRSALSLLTWRSSLFGLVLFSSVWGPAVETVSLAIFLLDQTSELIGFEVPKSVFLIKRFTMNDCEKDPPWKADCSEMRPVLAGSQTPALKSSFSTWRDIENNFHVSSSSQCC